MRKFALMCGVAAALMVAPSAKAIDLAEVGLSTGVYSNYVFRGFNLDNSGLASDAYATFNLSNRLTLTPYIWNWTSLNNNIAGKMDALETDYSASLSWVPPMFNDKVTLTGGYTYYDIHRAAFAADTQEMYFGLDIDMFLSPAVYVYQDIDAATGTYINVSGGHSWNLGESGWVFDLTGAAGFDVSRLGPSQNGGFQDAVVSTSLSYDLGDGLTLSPAIDWCFPSAAVDPGANGFRPVFSLGFSWAKSY